MNNIICLTPVRNGSKFIKKFFEYNYDLFDGFLFLDDGSSDNTYELLQTEKTIDILQKEFVDDFNDAENRNLLLDSAKTIDSRWFMWLDIDELIYPNLDITEFNDNDVITINLVHLWNSMEEYNSEYPYSNNGLQRKCRIFNKRILNNNYRFDSDRKLHFSLLDENLYENSSIIHNSYILHMGHMDMDNRIRKYNLYMEKDDKNYQPIGYGHFLNHNAITSNVKDLIKK